MNLNIPKPILEKTKVMVTHPIEINVIRIDEMLMHFNLKKRDDTTTLIINPALGFVLWVCTSKAKISANLHVI